MYRLIKTESIKLHSKEYLQNISQALFFKNEYFGFLLILMSVIFRPPIFIFGILASLIGYIYSTLNRTPKILKQNGLLTINGLFFGVAFASLFQEGITFYFCFALGSFAVPLITKASYEVLQHWKLSPLIIPYIIAIWVFWLCADGINLLTANSLLSPEPIYFFGLLPEAELWVQLLKSMFFSISQIFFFKDPHFGLCLLVLVFCFNAKRGLFFLMGTAIATLIFYSISNGSFNWQNGFLSCSASLVGLGLASQPENFNRRTIALFCVISLFITIAIEKILISTHLPGLSLPFVVTFWFAILSRAPRLNISWATSEIN